MTEEAKILRAQARQFDECAAIAKLYNEGKLAKRLWEYAVELRTEAVVMGQFAEVVEREACRE